jgi:ParB-like nuclease domain
VLNNLAMVMQSDRIETILIEHIRIGEDGKATQLRERTNEEIIERYAEDLENGDQFPAIDLVPVGDGTYYIADGWHRVLAHQRIGRGIVDAIILTVVDGQDPLETAKRYALRANQKHGLQLTRGDQGKRARTALLMPAYRYFSLRELEGEIGVSKSTISRVKNDLVMERLIPWGDTDEPIPDYVPRAYSYDHKLAFDPFQGDYDLKEEVFRFVNKLSADDPREWAFIHADGAGGEHQIIHQGIVYGEEWRIPLSGNNVVDGIPQRYEKVDVKPPRKLTKEELDRLSANKAKWEFFAARKRLMKHPDKRFREAIRTLSKYREAPRLWRDLSTFILSGGPEQEHRGGGVDDEEPDF